MTLIVLSVIVLTLGMTLTSILTWATSGVLNLTITLVTLTLITLSLLTLSLVVTLALMVTLSLLTLSLVVTLALVGPCPWL